MAAQDARTLSPPLMLVIRFVGVGVLNAGFGYGLYALLVWLGLNLFAAQLAAHLVGMAFNYGMFKRHVFRRSNHAVLRFCAAYAFNYGLSLLLLMLFRWLFDSAYVAGLLSMIGVAVVNFAVLRFAVFREQRPLA